MEPKRIHVITGGKFHDFDYSRLVLLQIMSNDDSIRATCAHDFSGIDALENYKGIILCTCDLIPDKAEAQAMQNFVNKGGRIFAIHAVNAPIEFTDGPAIVASGVNIPGVWQFLCPIR